MLYLKNGYGYVNSAIKQCAIIKLLISYGVDVNKLNSLKESALIIGLEKGVRFEII